MGKICIIGGSGFVGTRLIKQLNENSCVNIDKNNSELFPGITTIQDIRNPGLDRAITSSADTVVLLAAEHRDDIRPFSLYYDVNVQGTKNVLSAMNRLGIKKIIFTSSVAIYGLNKPNPDENYPADPFNHYGRSKFQAEEILRSWYQENPQNRTLIILRPTVIFGECNRGNVYNLLKQIAEGKFLMIGKGENKKSMAYVGNVVAFINHCLNSIQNGYHIFNYIDKPDLSIKDLIKQSEASLGKKLPSISLPYWAGMAGGYIFDALSFVSRRKFAVSSIRVKKFCATTQYDATKAHCTGFKAPFSLNEGLDRTIRYEFIETNRGPIFYSE